MALVVLFSSTTGNNKNKFKKANLGSTSMKKWLLSCKYFLLVSARVICRIFFLSLVFIVYLLQLIVLGLQRKLLASILLAFGARLVLRALGVQAFVCGQANDFQNKSSQTCIYLYNHQNPLDLFLIQGHLQVPSLTTAGLHLGWVFPWFSLSASNAGHVLMNHRNPLSRRSAMHRASSVIRRYGSIVIAPNGSLKTSIFQRVSASALVLARKHQSLIIPCYFSYSNLEISEKYFYNPLIILAKRLPAPLARIECRIGLPTDLGCPADFRDREGFRRAVQAYYREQQELG
jgi:capsular polysaccharide export protein